MYRLIQASILAFSNIKARSFIRINTYPIAFVFSIPSALAIPSMQNETVFYSDKQFSASSHRVRHDSRMSIYARSESELIEVNAGPVFRINSNVRFYASLQPGFYFGRTDKGVGISVYSELYMRSIYRLETEFRLLQSLSSGSELLDTERFYKIGVKIDWFTQPFDTSIGYWSDSDFNGLYVGVTF